MKSFIKDISVFALVFVVFSCLFVYRKTTYATYTDVSYSQVKQIVKDKKNACIVVDSNNSGYGDVITKYLTKNRKNTIYYTKNNKVMSLLGKKVSTPSTFILKNGKVTSEKSGALQYYYLKDFIKEN